MLSVGQKLWFVPSDRRGAAHEVEVLSIGRWWVQISNRQRINVETLYADGGQYPSPGRCFLSREVFEQKVQIDEAWSAFRRSVADKWSTPNGVTVDAINAAKQALGF